MTRHSNLKAEHTQLDDTLSHSQMLLAYMLSDFKAKCPYSREVFREKFVITQLAPEYLSFLHRILFSAEMYISFGMPLGEEFVVV